MIHALNVLHNAIREHGKRGNGITHKLARAMTGEGPRSPHWPVVEHRWKTAHPNCAACGGSQNINVHHIQSFATHPQLELWDCSGIPPGTGPKGGTPNFITLCMGPLECHIKLGHGGSFQHGGYNPNVVADCATVRQHPQSRSQVEARAKANRITPAVVNASA